MARVGPPGRAGPPCRSPLRVARGWWCASSGAATEASPAAVGWAVTPASRAGLDGSTPVAGLRASRSGVLSSSCGLRTAAERDGLPLVSRFVRPSFRLSLRPRAGPRGPARPGSCSSPPRVRRTDRRETSAGPKGGEAGGRCGRSPLGASFPRAVGAPPGRGRGRRRRGRRAGGVALFPRRQFPSPNTWAGYPRRRSRPGVGGGSKPRAASPGEAGDVGAPPRLPTSPPAAAGPPERRGPGPSRAPGPLCVETQPFASCLVLSFRGRGRGLDARCDPSRLNRQ